MAYSPYTHSIAVGFESGSLWIEDTRTKKVAHAKLSDQPISAIAFSANGTKIAVGCTDGQIVIEPISLSNSIAKWKSRTLVSSIQWLPSTDEVATGFENSTEIEIHEEATGRLTRILLCSDTADKGDSVVGLGYSTKMRRFYGALASGTISEFNIEKQASPARRR
jgi:WD40 repeat protein